MSNQKNNAQIIEEYSSTVYRLAFAMLQNKSDADDVYQEVFLRYVKRRPQFHDAEHGKAWFLRVTSNCAKSLAASPFRKRTTKLPDEQGSYSMDEQGMEVRELVGKLAPKYRRVIHLFYFEDMSIAQMSRVLGIKQTTIRSQLSRARQILKDSATGEKFET